jgi:hypothetical protein
MSSCPRLRFALRQLIAWGGFAFQDLTAWGAWRTTLAVLVNLSFVCAVVIGAFGLIYGASRVGRQRLESQRWSLRLLLGDNLDTCGDLTEEFLNDLRRRINGKLPEGREIHTVSPFRVPEYSFLNAGGDARPLLGRTISLCDGRSSLEHPLLRDCPLRRGRGFRGPDDPGVLVCPSMLRDLGYRRIPNKLIAWVNAKKRDVPIVGVLDRDLPERNVRFIITETYDLDLSAPDPPLDYVYTGPMHSDWPHPDDFPERLRTAISKKLPSQDYHPLQIEEDVLTGDRRLLLRWKGRKSDRPAESDWRLLLEQLRRLLDEHFGTQGSEDFVQKLDDRDQIPEPKADPAKSYDMVGLYFEQVDDLLPAVDVCESTPELKGHVDRGMADQLTSLHRQSSALLNLAWRTQAALIIMAVCNLWIIEVLRASKKVGEAGMLRAIGMSRWGLLMKLILPEVLILWAVGAGLGIWIGWLGGTQIADKLYKSPLEAGWGFVFTTYGVVWVLLVAAGISVTSSLLATLRWYWCAPAQLLSEH